MKLKGKETFVIDARGDALKEEQQIDTFLLVLARSVLAVILTISCLAPRQTREFGSLYEDIGFEVQSSSIRDSTQG